MVSSPFGKGAVNGCESLRLAVTVVLPQLSVAVAVPGFTFVEHEPGTAVMVMSAGQVITGAVVSLTVKTTVSLLLLPASSVAVTVTVCEPGATMVPASGL